MRQIVDQEPALPVFDENTIGQAVNQRPQQIVLLLQPHIVLRQPRVFTLKPRVDFRDIRVLRTIHRLFLAPGRNASGQNIFFAINDIHSSNA